LDGDVRDLHGPGGEGGGRGGASVGEADEGGAALLGDADAVALGDGGLARGDDAVPGPEAVRDHDAAAGGGPELGRAPLRDEAGGVLGHDEHARAALVAHDGVEREDEDVVELLAADLELDD